MEQNESLKDLQNTIHQIHISIIVVPEGERKGGRELIWKNNGQKITKPEEVNEYLRSRTSKYSNEIEPKEAHNEIRHNQMAKHK